MSSTALSKKQLKQQVREQGHSARNSQEEKDSLSQQIVGRFMELPEYAAATTVMFYVDVRSEVRTRFALPAAIESEKRIVVPYCVDGELELFLLETILSLALMMKRY